MLGATTARVVWRHILPNALGPVIVAGTINVASAIIAESTLSFLGLGDPDNVSWGSILEQGFAQGAISQGAWWFLGAPGLWWGLLAGLAVVAVALLARFLVVSKRALTRV